MMNKETRYAVDYHEATKHSEISLMTQRHYLDFTNRPIPFKIYTSNFPMYVLPSNFPHPTLDAITSISTTTPQKLDTRDNGSTYQHSTDELGVRDLAEILFFSAGITRKFVTNSVTYYMRAASATGALYPIELYVVCTKLAPDLEGGVYHFNPAEFGLTQIRKGDQRHHMAAAMAEPTKALDSPVNLIFTSLAWRNAWKYQARSYRHWFWDSGVIVANFLATTEAVGLKADLNMGFVDDKIDRLLCLERHKEATIVVANISGRRNAKHPPEVLSPPEMKKETVGREFPEAPVPKIRPLSGSETSYPEIWTIHDASSLFSVEESREWVNGFKSEGKESQAQMNIRYDSSENLGAINTIPIPTLRHDRLPNNVPSLAEVVLKRGSTRRFANTSIPFSILSTILASSTVGVPLDFFRNEVSSLIDIYLICNNVEGIPLGGYFFNRKMNTLDLVKLKVSREMSGYLCLGQSLFSQASAVLFLMTSLQKVLGALGNRGYRASQFEAGIIAGKIYLAAYAQGIGASGSTFFDDAVTEFFSPHAKSKNTMIAVGIGNPAYKAGRGKILPVRLTREEQLKGRL
jgi:SagB-type dehydrogenase family enzyme